MMLTMTLLSMQETPLEIMDAVRTYYGNLKSLSVTIKHHGGQTQLVGDWTLEFKSTSKGVIKLKCLSKRTASHIPDLISWDGKSGIEVNKGISTTVDKDEVKRVCMGLGGPVIEWLFK